MSPSPPPCHPPPAGVLVIPGLQPNEIQPREQPGTVPTGLHSFLCWAQVSHGGDTSVPMCHPQHPGGGCHLDAIMGTTHFGSVVVQPTEWRWPWGKSCQEELVVTLILWSSWEPQMLMWPREWWCSQGGGGGHGSTLGPAEPWGGHKCSHVPPPPPQEVVVTLMPSWDQTFCCGRVKSWPKCGGSGQWNGGSHGDRDARKGWLSPWLCGHHGNHIFWCGHGNIWPYSGGMANAMTVAIGPVGRRLVAVANGMVLVIRTVMPWQAVVTLTPWLSW